MEAKQIPNMVDTDSVTTSNSNFASAENRFKNLIFPLHDVWYLVHAGKDLDLKDECLKIMRACGDFQTGFSPNEAFNDIIYGALERCRPLVDSIFVSKNLQSRFENALTLGGSSVSTVNHENRIDESSHSDRPRG